jgi:hypothetical protein
MRGERIYSLRLGGRDGLGEGDGTLYPFILIVQQVVSTPSVGCGSRWKLNTAQRSTLFCGIGYPFTKLRLLTRSFDVFSDET